MEAQLQIDDFIDDLKLRYPYPQKDKTVDAVVDVGMREFFEMDLAAFSRSEIKKKNHLTFHDFEIFCSLFGPLEYCQEQVYKAFREPFFHGFITYDFASKLLKQAGDFLIRFSASGMKDGTFTLDVFKQNEIQRYHLKYNFDTRKLLFLQQPYDSFRHFVEDPKFKDILKCPIQRDSANVN